MRRCAVSVPSNIAEGHARKSTGDFRRFLAIALGSNAELTTQLLIAQNLGYLTSAAASIEIADEVGRILNGLHKSLGTRKTA